MGRRGDMEVDRWRRTASAEAGYGQAHTDAGPFQFSDGGAGKGIQTMEVCDSAQDRKHCVKNLVLYLLVGVVCNFFSVFVGKSSQPSLASLNTLLSWLGY